MIGIGPDWPMTGSATQQFREYAPLRMLEAMEECSDVESPPRLSLERARRLILASSEAEMFPARSLLVAPEMASRACVLSLIGKLLPGPANVDAGSFLRAPALSVAISLSLLFQNPRDIQHQLQRRDETTHFRRFRRIQVALKLADLRISDIPYPLTHKLPAGRIGEIGDALGVENV